MFKKWVQIALSILFCLLLVACNTNSDIDIVQEDVKETMKPDLTLQDEKIIFSFKLEDSDKIVTIASSNTNDYLVLRMGTNEKIDLEYPQNKTHSWDDFEYVYYFRGGGAVNHGLEYDNLSFRIGELEYSVYYEYSAISGEYELGLLFFEQVIEGDKIIFLGETTKLKGDLNSMIGTLGDLYDTKVYKNPLSMKK